MCAQAGFHTQKGYELANENQLTSGMEDYLEMIFRLSGEEGFTRVHVLAENLSVKPSSASKMVVNLRKMGLVTAQRYGSIHLTPMGKGLGSYLIHRHGLINRLLCFINHSADELEQAEKIEHYIDERTVRNIESLLMHLEQDK